MRRIPLDQGLPRSTGRILRDLGWDAVHVGDVGLARATDSELLLVAALERRVVVTLDADFHALLAIREQATPSVIRIRREGLDGPAVAQLLVSCWPKIEQALAEGAAVSITATAIRIRKLPIGG
ncbi:DUF5615 family PIN-like protein [Deferrisoma camini]|uniref:DUF5615 family PIN-like protein n=1 Tax=Deferrisoma camini TaxID=1035120 RepID=UPI00046D1B01|nr:DUF5615 family PIN-like protein [Deferrisoma camini]